MSDRPRGRPNEMEPALIDFMLTVKQKGASMHDAAQALPHIQSGRITMRALTAAAKRLTDKGVLVRKHEYFRPYGSPDGVARRFRYWHADYQGG